MAKLLMQNGADPRIIDLKGSTAEHWAVKKGYINMLQYKLIAK
ncbi:unnamed protein product [Heterosigma akashiwo]